MGTLTGLQAIIRWCQMDLALWREINAAPGVVASLASPAAAAIAASAIPLTVGGSTKQLGIQKVKVSQIADRLDDTELELVGKAEVDEAYAQYRLVMGAGPVKETEPTAEQLTVMINKVVTRGSAPYADFSVLTPYARRTQRQMKAKGFLLQDDGAGNRQRWQDRQVSRLGRRVGMFTALSF